MPQGFHLRRSVITGTGLTIGATLAAGGSAHAATIEVDNLGDPAGPGACDAMAVDCSLRQAVAEANAVGTEDVIIFQAGLTGQITLTNGEIPVTGNYLYINGPGAGVLTVSANNASRIFNVNPAVAGDIFTIYDLTLTGGNVTALSPNGGNGGAIRNEDARLAVKESVLTLNTASGDGGAIYERGEFADGANTVVYATTISDNTAGDDGGAIYGYESAGSVDTSTVTGNHAGSAALNRGAGIYAFSGVDITDSTVSGNSPAGEGGGVWTGGGTDLKNSIVADNAATSGPDVFSAATVNAEFSLVESPSGHTLTPTVAASNLSGLDPQLGPLQNNGGQTPTRRPAPGSPVVDKGNGTFARDQRFMTRTVDNPNAANSTAAGADGTDIGAVELSLTEGPQPAPATPKKKKCKKKAKKQSATAAKCKKKKKK